MMIAVFAKKHKYELILDNFVDRPNFDLSYLRSVVVKGCASLRMYGSDLPPEHISDDILIVAACSGMLTNINFLDILDTFSERSVCLCCYKIGSKRDALVAQNTLLALKRYFDVHSYINSLAYIRCVANMTKNLSVGEMDEIKSHLNSLDSTPDLVRKVNAYDDLCVCLGCGGQVWVYASAVTKSLLRSLCRKFEKRIKIDNSTSHFGMFPRFRYRMFVVACLSIPCSEVLKCSLDWAGKKLGTRRAATT